MSPVQSTLAVQQVHVATDRRLLTANHSAVQPLAPPFYVTQEMLHRHILGRARVHGIEDQGEVGEGGVTCHLPRLSYLLGRKRDIEEIV